MASSTSREAFVAPTHLPLFPTANPVTSSHSACAVVATAASPLISNATINRRAFLASVFSLAVSLNIPDVIAAESESQPAFSLPPLPYAYDALQPAISSQIMTAHHDTHFAGYIKKLNAALLKLGPASSVSDDASLRKMLANLNAIRDEDLRTTIRNNGGGYLNHKHFFEQMAPGGCALTSGKLFQDIEKQFGSFDAFSAQFLAAANSLFGSGFVWLVKENRDGRLRITKYPNQDNPAMDRSVNTPLLACDCWEHSWYYQYGPKKADYFSAWWNLIDWNYVSDIYTA